MTIPVLPTPIDAAELQVASAALIHWRADDLTVDTVAGQVGTFARGATAACVDSNGVSFTAANAMPRWEARDWTGAGPRGHLGLLMGTADRLSWAANWRPRSLAFRVEFIEAGTVSTVGGAGVVTVTNDAATGARLSLQSSGTFYQLRHHNGTAEVVATLAAAPTAGQRVVLSGYLYADGSVQLWQQINGGAETATARTAANTLAATWASGATTRVNSVGTGLGGSNWFRRVKIVPGLPDRTTLDRGL